MVMKIGLVYWYLTSPGSQFHCISGFLGFHILLTMRSLVSWSSSRTQVSLVSSLHSTCRLARQLAISSLRRRDFHISHKTIERRRVEEVTASMVGREECGEVEVGQLQGEEGGGRGHWQLQGRASGGSSAFLSRCGR